MNHRGAACEAPVAQEGGSLCRDTVIEQHAAVTHPQREVVGGPLEARFIDQHRAILDAVIDQNADGAEAAMRGHLREVFSTISLLRLDSILKAPMIPATVPDLS